MSIEPLDVVWVALRAASFVLLFHAAGAQLFLALFGRDLNQARERIRRLGARTAVGGLVCVLAQLCLEPARLAGELSGSLDPMMWRAALGAAPGVASMTRVGGMLLLSVPAGRLQRVQVLLLLGAALALFSFVLTGHTTVSPWRWLLGPLLLVHLLIIALWLGALPALRIVGACEGTRVLVGVLRAFSRLAVWLVPLILIAGVGLALALVPSIAVLRQPYGEILLGKFAAFALLMMLAAWNQLRLTAAIEAGIPAAISALRLSVTVEQVLIALVLAATALMTGLFSPEPG